MILTDDSLPIRVGDVFFITSTGDLLYQESSRWHRRLNGNIRYRSITVLFQVKRVRVIYMQRLKGHYIALDGTRK